MSKGQLHTYSLHAVEVPCALKFTDTCIARYSNRKLLDSEVLFYYTNEHSFPNIRLLIFHMCLPSSELPSLLMSFMSYKGTVLVLIAKH